MVYEHTELLAFWTFFYRLVFLVVETLRFENRICFRPPVKGEKTPTQLGHLKIANLNHWTTPVRFTQLHITRDNFHACACFVTTFTVSPAELAWSRVIKSDRSCPMIEISSF
jgi:hypothetical protein